VFFDIGPFEMVVLVVLAVVIFGPEKLPKVVTEVMQFIRKVREFSDNAKADIRKELGPEFQDLDLDFSDLTPRGFVKKNLLDNPRLAGNGELKELRELTKGLDLSDIREDVKTLTAPPGAEGATRGSAGAAAAGAGAVNGSAAATSRLEAGEQPPFDADAT